MNEKTYACKGPCLRNALPYTAFKALVRLKRDRNNWICEDCSHPRCQTCQVPSDETVDFGWKERVEMLWDVATSGTATWPNKTETIATLRQLRKKTAGELMKHKKETTAGKAMVHNDLPTIIEYHRVIAEALEKTGKQGRQYVYNRKFHCEWCTYPPCSGCGKRRDRTNKRKENQLSLWYCQECWKKAAAADEEYPPCLDCGERRARAQEVRNHKYRTWRCTACWRKLAVTD